MLLETHQVAGHPVHALLQRPKARVSPAHGYDGLVRALGVDPNHRRRVSSATAAS